MNFRDWTVKQDELHRTLLEPENSGRSTNTDASTTEVSLTIEVPDPHQVGNWAKLGIYTPRSLKAAVKREAKQPYLVEGLLRTRSLNLLVGDSGLGKTPLAIQIGVSIAAGIPLFSRRVEKGPVLYCDAESSRPGFSETLDTISRFLKQDEPPQGFYVWSPNWDNDKSAATNWFTSGTALIERVREVQPSLVIVDALRTFWPSAESKNQDAAETFSSLRKLKDVTWLVLHHRRKANVLGVADLIQNPHAWFQEAAGALALVNQSDTRCGVVPHPGNGDLVLGGFIRGSGPMTPLDLSRATNDEGDPIGYTVLTGVEHLIPSDRVLYDALRERFRFRDVRERMGGTSDSNAARFLKKCVSLQIVRKDAKDYTKTDAPVVERVE